MIKLKYNIFLLLVLFTSITNAQTIHHYNMWSKLSIAQPITKQFKTEVDFQYRTQNNFFANNTPFDKHLLSSLIVTLNYQLNKNLSFSVSPFAYIVSHAIIQQENDIDRLAIREFRFSGSIDMQEQLANHFYLINKTGIEYRDFDSTADLIRLRNKIGLRYDLGEKTYLTIYEEPFFNISGATRLHFYDHNRLALLGAFKADKHWRVETGLMHINRLPRISAIALQEENIVVNLYYTLNTLINHKS